MATRSDMKKEFLGILRGDTVRELTKQSGYNTARKESKNNGVGMKNKRLRTGINNIVSEMTHNLESGNSRPKLPKETTVRDESGSSGNRGDLIKEESVVKQK